MVLLKLKRTPGIYLVGFMACGKTTVGRLLAEKLGWTFADIDDDVEAQSGSAIHEIFDQQGEEVFRRLEHDALAGRVRVIERGGPTVVALGGGAFARQDNYALVAANGVSIWLDCPLDVLLRRVAQESHRPLARDPEEFAELYAVRREAYRRADFQVGAESDDPEPVLRKILELPIF